MHAHAPIDESVERVGKVVLDSAFRVHKELGPGLLESVYETCMCHELAKAGVSFQRQLSLPICYDGVRLEGGLRLDILAGDCVVVELKTVETILPIFEAQMMTYLRLSHRRLGLLINFNVVLLKDGIRRIVI